MSQTSVAVIGSGISGLTAAYALQTSTAAAVTLFESDSRLGGHTHTHDVHDPNGHRYAVDSGFIVHNDRTYPRLRALFAELGVTARPTEMSMSIRCDGCGLQYAGGRGLGGVLARPSQLLRPRFVLMLASVRRFHQRARAFLADSEADDVTTLGEWLEQEGFNGYFIRHYAIPLVSCVWSSGDSVALQYPARYLFTFLGHHGMLALTDSPQWFTIVGGSSAYVRAIADHLPDVRRGDPVVSVTRTEQGVQVRTASGVSREFDRVVIATHADQALALLADPTSAEKEVLGAFDYSVNETVLHTDASLLPTARRARASWNYAMSDCTQQAGAARVTYWMNRLQGHSSSADYLVSLNAADQVDLNARLATMAYTHPVYTPESVAAQGQLASLFSDTTAYAGAHFGWGFHEDGCRSGHAAAEWILARR
ncbi:MAG: FAD-dependent oxidoreductase [Ornithinimicrobium sp.]